MKFRLISACSAGVVLAAFVTTAANAKPVIDLGYPPPPEPRTEVIPPSPPAGHVWTPGYWDWREGHYIWHRGFFAKAKAGHHWIPDQWERNGDDKYRYSRGHWAPEYRASNGPAWDISTPGGARREIH